MAAEVNITNTRSIRGNSFTVADLRALISGVDDSCRVTISTSGGGSQFDPTSHSITINDVKERRVTRGGDGRPMDTL